MVFVAVILVCLGWACLFLDSVHQRRKAQRLLSDLSELPIAADFSQVRDLASRYGGGPLNVQLQSPQSACTEHECNFEVKVQPAMGKLVEKNWELLHQIGESGLYLGLRPWIVTAVLTVRDGKLEHIHMNIAQERVSKWGDYTGPILMWYTVDIDRTATNYSDSGVADSELVVVRPHVTGAITEPLHSWAVQTQSGEWKLVLDVRLDCFTRVFQGCADFRELTPSAWDHYEAAKKSM